MKRDLLCYLFFLSFRRRKGGVFWYDKNNVKYQLIDESAHDNTLYFSLELLQPRSLITVLLQFLPSRVLEERLISSGHAIAASAFGYNEWKNDYCKDQGGCEVGDRHLLIPKIDFFLLRWERKREIYSSFNSSPIFRYSIIYIYIFY